jgi:prephenate dehydrogenase
MKIAIVGVGLIGGSIGLACRQLPTTNYKLHVTGIPRREETIAQAIRMGAIDEGTINLEAGVAEADLVFICTPINLIIPTLQKIRASLKPGAIVTDVGSTKEEIVKKAAKLMPKGTFFVGGHPMAGKEISKLGAAEGNLFGGKVWILIKERRKQRVDSRKQNTGVIETLKEVITMMGAKTVEMDAKTHDLVVAGISHLPLAVAAALVNTVAAEKEKKEMTVAAASGFRDTTRVASGDPELGVGMFKTNKKAILKMIGGFKKSMARMERLIKAGNSEAIKKELEKAKNFRDTIGRQFRVK